MILEIPSGHQANMKLAIDRWTHPQGVGVLVLSRLMPLISFNVINYAAGLSILPITTLLVVTSDQVWNGCGHAWSWLVTIALAGVLLWFFVVRRRGTEQ